MTDIIKSENNVPIRFADMGDGTYAEVTATNLFSSGANFNLIGDGKSLTSTGTSVSTLIPFDSTSLLAAGSVRVAVTDPGYIRIENTEAAASATDILVNPEDSILINTEGKRFISFVSLVGEATANIQPVGNNSFKMFESSLDLNFLSNEYVFNNDFVSFSSIATFTRNSAATFVGSNGLIQSAPANTPRFDYDPVTLQPRGFLVEEQRTNLLTFSEQFENAVWTKVNTTVSSNVALSPDGSVDADKLIATAVGGDHRINNNPPISVLAGQSYTMSIYAKAADYGFVRLSFGNTAGGGVAFFNLTLGTIGTVSSGSGDFARIENVGGGWYRISFSRTTTVSGSISHDVYVQTQDNQFGFTGDGTSGIFVWGAQLELNAPTSYIPTSYIPTTTAQATRLADSAKIDGANFAAFYKQSEGTIYAEVRHTSTASYPVGVSVNNGTLNHSSFLNFSTTAGHRFSVRNNAVVQADIAGANYSLGAISKFAAVFRQNDFIAYQNGVATASDTSGVVPEASQMELGRQQNGGDVLNGHIRRIMYIPKRLSNTELQALTI